MSWRKADVGMQVRSARRIVVGMVTVRCWTSGDVNVVVLGSAGGSETHGGRSVRCLTWLVGGFRLMATGFGRNLCLDRAMEMNCLLEEKWSGMRREDTMRSGVEGL